MLVTALNKSSCFFSTWQMEDCCPSVLGSPSLFRQNVDCNRFLSAYMLLLLLASPKKAEVLTVQNSSGPLLLRMFGLFLINVSNVKETLENIKLLPFKFVTLVLIYSRGKKLSLISLPIDKRSFICRRRWLQSFIKLLSSCININLMFSLANKE